MIEIRDHRVQPGNKHYIVLVATKPVSLDLSTYNPEGLANAITGMSDQRPFRCEGLTLNLDPEQNGQIKIALTVQPMQGQNKRQVKNYVTDVIANWATRFDRL